MDVKTMLRQQMESLHGTLEAAVGDCSAEYGGKEATGGED